MRKSKNVPGINGDRMMIRSYYRRNFYGKTQTRKNEWREKEYHSRVKKAAASVCRLLRKNGTTDIRMQWNAGKKIRMSYLRCSNFQQMSEIMYTTNAIESLTIWFTTETLTGEIDILCKLLSFLSFLLAAEFLKTNGSQSRILIIPLLCALMPKENLPE